MSTDQTAQPTLPAGLPDDWRLDRDVACPKCGYNLRMMRAPRCPECGAVHRWQELLEISCPRCAHALTGANDAACPRCRLELNWAALLDDSAIHSHNFEYDSDPLRSAIRTGFRSLFPRRMWRHFVIESTPRVARLSRLRRFSIAVGTVAALLPIIASYPYLGFSFIRLRTRYFSLGDVVSDSVILFALILGPVAITALLLPRFTPTLATFRIRREQLLRIFAYGRFAWIWSGVLLLVAYAACIASILGLFVGGRSVLILRFDFVGDLLRGHRSALFGYWYDWGEVLSAVLLLSFIYLGTVWWWRFLYVALHDYLRINRGNAIALIVSTQAVAWLVIAVTLILIHLLLLVLTVGW